MKKINASTYSKSNSIYYRASIMYLLAKIEKMTNGNKYYSFLHYLAESGELNQIQANAFRHTCDLLFKDMLVDLGMLSQEHACYLWAEYIRGKRNIFLRGARHDQA